MPGPWKAWKTKNRFSTLPTAPWKSRQKRASFPHSHSSDDEADGKVENQKQVFHFPTAFLFFQEENRAGGFAPARASTPFGHRKERRPRQYRWFRVGVFRLICIGNKPPFQAHVVLETNSHFRLIFELENAGADRAPEPQTHADAAVTRPRHPVARLLATNIPASHSGRLAFVFAPSFSSPIMRRASRSSSRASALPAGSSLHSE